MDICIEIWVLQGTVRIDDNDFGGATMPMWWSKGGLLWRAIVFYGRRAVKFMPPGHDGRVRGSAASGWSQWHILLWRSHQTKWFHPRLARLVPFLSRLDPTAIFHLWSGYSLQESRIMGCLYVHLFVNCIAHHFILGPVCNFPASLLCALPLLKEKKINNGLFWQIFERAGTQNIRRHRLMCIISSSLATTVVHLNRHKDCEEPDQTKLASDLWANE